MRMDAPSMQYHYVKVKKMSDLCKLRGATLIGRDIMNGGKLMTAGKSVKSINYQGYVLMYKKVRTLNNEGFLPDIFCV